MKKEFKHGDTEARRGKYDFWKLVLRQKIKEKLNEG